MTNRWERLNDLYHTAVALPRNERALLVAEACAEDPELQAGIERLIAAHDRANPFLLTPPLGTASLSESGSTRSAPTAPASPPTSDRVGPYRLLKEARRSPLGTTYVATRADGPTEHRVALTPIAADTGADQLLDGLRAANQSLGSREHPNIARLIAIATADDGRPYVVMEHIDGEPIDEFVN
jgi:hypothetical protein